jgi:hypothetical protein
VRFSERPADYQFKDMTVDPGLAADLLAIETADSDWYGLVLDSNSEAEILAAAAFIETRDRIFLTNNSDTEIVDGAVTTDVLSDLQGFAYIRTALLYSQSRLLNWSGAAWAGRMLPFDPGSATWSHKTLAGVSVDTKLTTAQKGIIDGKGGNTYRVVAGVNITLFGNVSSGSFLDITRGRDWLKARMQERVFVKIQGAPKVPFTDPGIAQIQAEVDAQLLDGVEVGLLAADPAPVTTVPLAANVSATDKQNRLLPDISFTATLAGAIHTVEISGVLSV